MPLSPDKLIINSQSFITEQPLATTLRLFFHHVLRTALQVILFIHVPVTNSPAPPYWHLPYPTYHEPPQRNSLYTATPCTSGHPLAASLPVRTWILSVELTHLSLNPLSPPSSRYLSSIAEDTFCVALFKIGGKQWRNE